MRKAHNLSLGLVVAGVLAAPATAMTIITENFNYQNDATTRPVVLGGNSTPQFLYYSDANIKSSNVYFEILGHSRIGFLSDVNGLVSIPSASDMQINGQVHLGSGGVNAINERYLPLEFQINGQTTYGNAFFTIDHGLDRVEYAATAVPEPEVWTELLAGFAIAGAAVRRRRSQAAAAA